MWIIVFLDIFENNNTFTYLDFLLNSLKKELLIKKIVFMNMSMDNIAIKEALLKGERITLECKRTKVGVCKLV